MSWIGQKKLAFIPVYRPHAHPPDQIPPEWNDDILRRVLFDPDPGSKPDKSLRTYIHTASSGLADLDAVIMPMQTVDQQDVPPDILEGQLGSQLRNQGFDAAAIVMLGGPGAGTSAGFWVRFVMAEDVGEWAMEFMHSLTGLIDLRSLPRYIDNGVAEDMTEFDEMASNRGMHPSAYTKRVIGWLDGSAITQHTTRTATYVLHSVGLIQPPPFGRSTAVQVGSQPPYLMIESRLMVDQFETNIGSEGVIVYRVQTTDPFNFANNDRIPLVLLTPTALTAGQTFTSDTGVTVQVVNAVPGGFSVSILDPNQPQTTIVPDVFELTATVAVRLVHQAGLVPKFTGATATNAWVYRQSPVAGEVVVVGSVVTMTLKTGPIP